MAVECTANNLAELAACFTGLSPKQQAAIATYLLCQIANNPGGGGGAAIWGDITGTLSDQTDLQSALDAKQATITGGATSIASANLAVSRALASDGAGKVVVSATTAAELAFVSGVTSAIQTQLNAAAIAARPLTGAGTPVGSVVPTYVGQFYTDLTGTQLFQASGLTNADWIQWI